jgi:catechol 2,3-dioxygenase-like lactoylglutathione lyase family enzyme
MIAAKLCLEPMALCILALCTSSVLFAENAPPGDVIGVGNFTHLVADLDRSIEFYRDHLGLELLGPQSKRPFAAVPAIQKATNTPGSQVRLAIFKVPGSEIGVEAAEFKDVERHPVRPRFQDPGSGNLILLVRDIDAMLASLKKAEVPIVTTGGVPVAIRGETRAVILTDPDGYFVELMQLDPLPETTAPSSSNIIGARFGMTIEDTDKTLKFYHDLFGFDAQAGAKFSDDKNLMSLAGTPGAHYRRSTAIIPGTSVLVEFIEFKDIDRKTYHSGVQDPGTASLQLRVRDMDAMVEKLKYAGDIIISAGAEPQNVSPTLTLFFARDPNNIVIELLQTHKSP